jgi:hypothetical protein
MKKIDKPILLTIFLSLASAAACLGGPATASAQTITSFGGFASALLGILQMFVNVIVSLAIVYFLWGVAKFIRAEDDKGREEGKKQILWGLVGLFVMLSVWGLLNVLKTTFPLENTRLNAPQL